MQLTCGRVSLCLSGKPAWVMEVVEVLGGHVESARLYTFHV